MILNLEFTGRGCRGGELYHAHLHSFLKFHFDDVVPAELLPFPEHLRSHLLHIRFSLNQVNRYRPQLVVCDISSAARNYPALRSAKKHGARVLLVAQGQRFDADSGSVYRKWWIDWAESRVASLADIAVVNSRFTAAMLRQRRTQPVPTVTAFPGFEFDRFAEREPRKLPGRIKLLFVGECSRVKGLIYLIQALHHLQPFPIELDVVGGHNQEPDYYRRVEELIESRNLQMRINFHGFLDRPALDVRYREASILVAPSLSEGYGMVLAEAFCFGLPVVASDAGAIGEIVENDKNGLLVPPENSGALASAIKRLATEPEVYEQISLNNIERAKSLPTWEDFETTLDSHLEPLLTPMVG